MDQVSAARTAIDQVAMLRRVATRLEYQCDWFLRNAYGLSWPQFQVLQTLSPDRPTPLQQVNELVMCTRSNLTALVDRLERDGWVERVRRKGDRRIVLLKLTAKAEQCKGEIAQRLDQHMEERLAFFLGEDDTVVEELTEVLEHLATPLPVRQVAASAAFPSVEFHETVNY